MLSWYVTVVSRPAPPQRPLPVIFWLTKPASNSHQIITFRSLSKQTTSTPLESQRFANPYTPTRLSLTSPKSPFLLSSASHLEARILQAGIVKEGKRNEF